MSFGSIIVRYGLYVTSSLNDARVTEVDKYTRITEEGDVRVIEKEMPPNHFLGLNGDGFMLLDGTHFNLL